MTTTEEMKEGVEEGEELTGYLVISHKQIKLLNKISREISKKSYDGKIDNRSTIVIYCKISRNADNSGRHQIRSYSLTVEEGKV